MLTCVRKWRRVASCGPVLALCCSPIGDCGSVEACKEIVVLRRSAREGFVLTPRRSQRATLVEHVIELPYLRVVPWSVLEEAGGLESLCGRTV